MIFPLCEQCHKEFGYHRSESYPNLCIICASYQEIHELEYGEYESD